MTVMRLRGVEIHKGFLGRPAQEELLDAVREILRAAPLVSPVTPSGRRMSVQMTSAGRFGWVTDRSGYRYQQQHPAGTDWPPIPKAVLDIWRAVSGTPRLPDSCLVNYYPESARMGLHQDRDEADFGQPVVSVSLGDAALFRIGNTTRGGPTESIWLESGDVAVLGGEARLAFHGIDRIRFGSSTLLKGGGRINLTLRVVT